MKKLAIAIVTLSATACATAEVSYEQAPVLESHAIYRTVEIATPERQCWQEEVARTDYRDRGGYNSYTPPLLGAVIGGAIGNELGHNKSNQRVGAVVGAVLGGSIARDITSRNRREPVTYYDVVQRCETFNHYRQEDKLVGYDVLYRYNGRDYSVRMPSDPGAYVRVRVDVEPVY